MSAMLTGYIGIVRRDLGAGMRRRQFIKLLGGVTIAAPLAARAQQPVMPVIGFMHPSTADRTRDVIGAFEEGLKATGYAAGKNIAIEYRWANDDYDRLPDIAQDLLSRGVNLIFAGTPVAARAAKRVANHTPIVFCVGSDPIKDGLVPSLSRPGENITGTTFFSDLLSAKRLELLHELARTSNRFGVLVNPKNVNAELEINDAAEAARSLGLELIFAKAQSELEIENSFHSFEEGHAIGVLIASDAFLNLHAEEIGKLALRYRLPTCFSFHESAVAGGLMSYGASRLDAFRWAASYVGRILHGEQAGKLPVQQPQVRVRPQPQDRRGARIERAEFDAIARRRGH